MASASQAHLVTWYENDGSQGFTRHTVAALQGARAVCMAMINGDELPDLVAVSLSADVDVLATGGLADQVVWYESDLADPAAVESDPMAGSPGERLTITPNPVRAWTAVCFELASEADVTVQIYATDGTLVRCLSAGAFPPGLHQMSWDRRDALGREVAAGIYFCRLRGGDVTQTRRIVCLE